MILPGIHLSLSALNHSTKNINALLGKSDYPASNTDDSVTTGILYSIMGAVNLVCRTRKPEIPILLTGGGADWIYKHADKDWRSRIKLKENLLFDGMRAYI
jgi:pantothenate kinase type III